MRTRFWLGAVVAAGFLCACSGGGSGKDPLADAGSRPPPQEVKTTVLGTVVDDVDGTPLADVEVRAQHRTTRTDAAGRFVLEDLTVPAERCALVVKKTGYFVTGKAAVPVANGVTRFRLRLVKKVNQPVAPTGGSVAIAGGSGVQFQASSFTKDGRAFAETVQVAARHLDPTASSFDAQFPGDLSAVRQDGSSTMLISFGVVQVELEDGQGEKVELAEGLPATLTFAVPASMKDQAPATIPLWYFDEDEGIWKEEGAATLEGDRYVGDVRHFTPWNCDQPEKTAWVTGAVTCNGKPLAGVPITAGPSSGTTGENGRFRIPVPANTLVTVRVAQSALFHSSVERQAGPIAPGDTEDVGVLPLDICPAHYRGRVVQESGKPISARVQVSWGGGGSDESDFQYAPGGEFLTVVPPDTDVVIVVTTEGGETATVARRTPASSQEEHLGDIVVKVAANCDFWDFAALPYRIALSPTGDLLASGPYDTQLVEIRDTATGTVKQTVDVGRSRASHLQFSEDGRRLLAADLFGHGPSIIDTSSGTVLRAFDPYSIAASWLTPDGASIVGMTSQGALAHYSVATGAQEAPIGYDLSTPHAVMGTRSSGRELLLLRSDDDGYLVTAWELVTDTEARSFRIGRAGSIGSYMLPYVLTGDGAVVGFELRDDSGSRGVYFWDTGTGQQILAEPFWGSGPGADAALTAFKPDGTALITQEDQGGSNYGPPTLYSFPGLARQFTVPWPMSGRVDDYSFSDDGHYLAMGRHGDVVRIVDLTSCH